MVRPDYRNFQHIAHSAKGSVWENHKYVKRVNGTYYYPNGYEGGRTMESFRRDLRNKRFTQAQVNADASSKKTSSSKGTTNTNKKAVANKAIKRLGTAVTFGTQEFGETKKTSKSSKKVTDKNLSAKDIEKYAKEVIRGNYGVGAERKELLGDNYRKIQDKVNELMKAYAGKKVTSTKTAKATSTTKKVTSKAKKTTSSKKSTTSTTPKAKGIDLEKVYSVYNKKKR